MEHGDQGALVSGRTVKEGRCPLREEHRGQRPSVKMPLRP